jgi:hypothetical protein
MARIVKVNSLDQHRVTQERQWRRRGLCTTQTLLAEVETEAIFEQPGEREVPFGSQLLGFEEQVIRNIDGGTHDAMMVHHPIGGGVELAAKPATLTVWFRAVAVRLCLSGMSL